MPEGTPQSPSPEYPPEVIRAAMDRATNDVLRDVPALQTVTQLAAMGLDAETAAVLYGQVRSAIKRTRQRTAIFLMISGAFWLIACGVAWLTARFAWTAPTPGTTRALVLLAAIAIIQLLAGFFRWRRAARL